jgi:hypothetical protein
LRESIKHKDFKKSCKELYIEKTTPNGSFCNFNLATTRHCGAMFHVLITKKAISTKAYNKRYIMWPFFCMNEKSLHGDKR